MRWYGPPLALGFDGAVAEISAGPKEFVDVRYCGVGLLELFPPCSSQPGHRDEAVEVCRPPGFRIEVDRVPAAEKSGHDGLGDARGQAGGDCRVGGAATRFEDLRTRVCCGGMPGGDGSHALSVNRVPILG